MVLKTDFVRSQENAQDALNDNFEQLAPLVEDTGWMDVPLTQGAVTYSSNPAQYRIRGGDVEFRGAINGSTYPVDTSSAVYSALLPVTHSPAKELAFKVSLLSAVATDMASIYLGSDGKLKVVSSTGPQKGIWLSSIRYSLG